MITLYVIDLDIKLSLINLSTGYSQLSPLDTHHALTKDAEPGNVPGHIHLPCHLEYWLKTFTLSSHIHDLLLYGYVPSLMSWPPISNLRDNKSARDPNSRSFIASQLRDLERSGAISRVTTKPWCVLPLQVVHRENKGPRLVIDASRQINPHINNRHVRLTTLKIMNEGIDPVAWWASLDLKSGYYHIKIHPGYRRLFGIRWISNDQEESFYVWNVCFLGLSDLVYTFTKLFRPILRHLHGLGIKLDIYIDDLRVTASSKKECAKKMEIVREILSNSGFVEAKSKAIQPTQCDIFLGLVNNTRHNRYYIPDFKLAAIRSKIEYITKHKRAKIRDVASLYGSLFACTLAIGPILKLPTRIGQKAFAVASVSSGWDGWMDVRGLRDELEYLHTHLDSLNGFPFDGQELKHVVDFVLASHASNIGFGVIEVRCGSADVHKIHTDGCEKSLLLKESFANNEMGESSTFRELLAIRSINLNEKMISHLSGKGVAHLTDSQCAASIMKIGSPTTKLQQLALDIHHVCRVNQIRLRVHWRPREDPRLQAADARSRHFDTEDWGPDYDGFLLIEQFSSKPFDID
ncbi:uncharacterized protein LOC131892091 [Tigriopus californicus]|uniref:uncharacterized protein LOC131892091 n=1 Tax=Tigriopus californicus TaxID=6832 RepID=UPI0027DA006E|nr:uncharacterized protein LOC131892091 [Tigriopus californicus]XP_059097814.1 uncharacterized protein LOC131892091 [Tigriopus californicus]XP_059097815.1 uncharacterized protein LOC131892091 [Tigriopus californicus]XP_059097816.1 uncharacterized protein LOC131892091 [Tigriopus californicus]